MHIAKWSQPEKFQLGDILKKANYGDSKKISACQESQVGDGQVGSIEDF